MNGLEAIAEAHKENLRYKPVGFNNFYDINQPLAYSGDTLLKDGWEVEEPLIEEWKVFGLECDINFSNEEEAINYNKHIGGIIIHLREVR